jgi:ABC-type Mn2+/Zn2+ transport system permease subunit
VSGLYCSYAFNLPIGAAIVCVLGVALLLVRVLMPLLPAKKAAVAVQNN